jgi:disulfide oxidoreductase YuzD
MGNLKVDDDGGMQYWQQMGQQEEQEFFNPVIKTEDENVSNGYPAPMKSGISRRNLDGIYSER